MCMQDVSCKCRHIARPDIFGMSYSRAQWKSVQGSKYDFNALIYACIFSVLQREDHEVSLEQLTHTTRQDYFMAEIHSCQKTSYC